MNVRGGVGKEDQAGNLSKQLTVCKAPDKILSVVAWISPLLLCSSHKAVLRSTCGNICCILPTAASLALSCTVPFRLLAAVEALSGFGAEKKRYLVIRPTTTTKNTSAGNDTCSLDIVLGVWCVCAKSATRSARKRKKKKRQK